MNWSSDSYAGLFGYLGTAAVVKNLGLENVTIIGAQYVGALAGYSLGLVCNCYSKGSVSASSLSVPTYAGGLIGYSKLSNDFLDNYSTCSVSAYANSSDNACAGGLIGYFLGPALMARSYATGAVTSLANKCIIGGMVGLVSNCTIYDCYALGNVKADASNANSCIGGFVGNSSNTSVCPTNSFARGSVSGKYGNIGGFAGLASGGIYYSYAAGKISSSSPSTTGGFIGSGSCSCTASFWDKEISEITTSKAGIGLTTAQMKSPATFISAGWDFVGESLNGTNDRWHMPFNSTGYPMLLLQRDITGDITGRYGVDYSDFAALASLWKSTNSSPKWNTTFDISQPTDNKIDFKDLSVIASNWLKGI